MESLVYEMTYLELNTIAEVEDILKIESLLQDFLAYLVLRMIAKYMTYLVLRMISKYMAYCTQ